VSEAAEVGVVLVGPLDRHPLALPGIFFAFFVGVYAVGLSRPVDPDAVVEHFGEVELKMFDDGVPLFFSGLHVPKVRAVLAANLDRLVEVVVPAALIISDEFNPNLFQLKIAVCGLNNWDEIFTCLVRRCRTFECEANDNANDDANDEGGNYEGHK